jgi:HEAT repeat protein
MDSLEKPNRSLRRHSFKAIALLDKSVYIPDRTLILGIEDEDAEVQFSALQALKKRNIQNIFLLPSLFESLPKRDARFLALLSEYLSSIPQSTFYLNNSLQNQNPHLRLWAIKTSGKMKQPPLHLISKALKDSEESVRLEALLCLEKMGIQALSCLPQIISMIHEENPNCRILVENILKNLEHHSLPVLMDTASSSNLALRKAALYMMGKLKIDTKEVIQTLQNYLEDPDPQTRQEALCALGEILPLSVDVLPQTIDLLQKDPSPRVRSQALKNLIRIF